MKHWQLVLFIVCCAVAALAPLTLSALSVPVATTKADGFPGWPSGFGGKALTQLPMTPLEQRFGQQFPGQLGRFSDGEREIILRWVAEGSRKLHASSDCFKANGYTLTTQPIHVDGAERWSVFLASRGATRFTVRERITDAAGRQWTDVSAWYWAVQLGQTTGPWWAVTIAQQASTAGPANKLPAIGRPPD